nr:lysozyme inhibitor LprI family protein [Bradyrhizobium diazoefficiens]
MRFTVLDVLIVLAPLVLPAAPGFAQSEPPSIADRLPLFAKNNCQRIRDSGNQLFCGDATLAAAAEKLNTAIEARLARLPDRLPAIEENAIWIRQRNLSCGIVGQTALRTDDFDRVKTCLLKVTEERAAIVRDPDFDCLAANTAAGALICADPSLALAETELNGEVLGLIGKLDPVAALCLRRIWPVDERARSQMQSGRQGERAASGARSRGGLSLGTFEAQDRRDPCGERRAQESVWPASRGPLARLRRGRLLRGADPCGQFVR